jgi:hypothetical protein
MKTCGRVVRALNDSGYLQEIHDITRPDAWPQALADLAALTGLDPKVVTKHLTGGLS